VTVELASAVPVIVGVGTLVIRSDAEAPLSEPFAKAKVLGALITVSIVSVSAPAEETLPAASVALAFRLWLPSAKTALVIDQEPEASAVAEPSTVDPSNSVTVLPTSAVPVIVGVVTLVTRSVFDDPLSEAGAKVSVGTTGAEVSIVSARLLAEETLPAASLALALRLWLPSVRTGLVIDQAPEASAIAEPSTVEPSYSVTVELASAVPFSVGVVSFVIRSVCDKPLSEIDVRARVGATGAVVSMATVSALETAETFPAASVALALRL